MKKILILTFTVFGLLTLACENANYAKVKLSNPDGNPVAFGGSFLSDMVDSTVVSGTTPATYEIEVNPNGDHVWVSFLKSAYSDTENELKVELYYMGDLKEAQTTKIPLLLGAVVVECAIP